MKLASALSPHDLDRLIDKVFDEEHLATHLIDPDRIDEIEKVTKHDVIAFLEAVAEQAGPRARHLHAGLTSHPRISVRHEFHEIAQP